MRGRGEVPREAHNLETAVQFGPPRPGSVVQQAEAVASAGILTSQVEHVRALKISRGFADGSETARDFHPPTFYDRVAQLVERGNHKP